MTLDDRTAARLISQNLVEPISPEQQRLLSEHLSSSEKSRNFEDLSRQIQHVVQGASPTSGSGGQRSSRTEPEAMQEVQDSLEEPGPGLSQLARIRLAKRLSEELQTKEKPFQQRQVAEDGTEYRRDDRSNESSD